MLKMWPERWRIIDPINTDVVRGFKQAMLIERIEELVR